MTKDLHHEARILIESARYDLATVKARLRWLADLERRGPEEVERNRQTYGGTAAEIEQACREEWQRLREQRR